MPKLDSKSVKIGLLLSLTSSVISLSFLDPINWPKQIALATFAPYVVFLASSRIKKIRNLGLPLKLLFVLYFFFGLVASVVSEVPLTRLLWGTFGRSNGLVTYISLGLIAIAGFYVAQKKYSLLSLLIPLIAMLFVAGVYGILQKLYLDPIKWSQDGQAFAFFGNINFASALFSLGAMTCLGLSLVPGFKALSKGILLVLTFFFILLVYLTGSIQGLLMFGISGLIYVFIILQKISNKLALPFLGFSIFTGLFLFWSFLGQGPLGETLYQYTLKLRYYYVISGLLMGIKHLPFGVGIDSYGDYYREVRPSAVVEMTGIDITVNNAHSSLVQIFATLGVPATVVLLLMYMYAFRNSFLVLIRRNVSIEKKIFIGIFISLTLNSFLSIDNISIAVWNYLFLGVAMGTLFEEDNDEERNESSTRSKISHVNSSKSLLDKQKYISVTLAIAAFILSWTSSYPERKIISVFQEGNPNVTPISRIETLVQVSENPLTRDQNFRYIAEGLSQLGDNDSAIQVLQSGVKRFPREYQLFDYLSVFLEKSNRKEEAILIRRNQIELDPNHPKIWLYYAFDLYDLGKVQESRNAFQEVIKRKQYLSVEDQAKLDEYKLRIGGE